MSFISKLYVCANEENFFANCEKPDKTKNAQGRKLSKLSKQFVIHQYYPASINKLEN